VAPWYSLAGAAMDPLSVFATAATLLDITARTSGSLRNLYGQLKAAPALILALSNETADITVVLNRVADAKQTLDRLDKQQNAAFIASINNHLSEAKAVLSRLEALSNTLLKQEGSIKRIKWCLRSAQAATLKDEIRAVRQRINEILAAHTV
jgi:DNA repair exonuclease SbcCD ATPase subunit